MLNAGGAKHIQTSSMLHSDGVSLMTKGHSSNSVNDIEIPSERNPVEHAMFDLI